MKKQVLISVLMLLPVVANAAVEYNGLWYNLNSNNNTAEVVASQGAQYSGSISIESSVCYQNKWYHVTSLATSAFEGCADLTSVSIPYTITTIGASAFSGCTALNSISIPYRVKSIGNSAFSGCSGLTSVTIPNSVTSIESRAFSNCAGLTTILLEISDPFYISDDVFYNNNKDIYTTATLYVPAGKLSAYQSTAGWKNFQNIVEIGLEFEADGIRYKTGVNNTVSVIERSKKYSGDIIIPNQVLYNGKNYTVTSIGGSAFFDCNNLTSINIPNGITSIGYSAFSGCSNLTSIIIPEGVTEIGSAAFDGCSGLTSITIPNSVTYIGFESFRDCNALASVNISDISAWVNIVFDFNGSGVYTNNPLYYAHHLFINGVEIKDLVIPNSVANIKGFAFAGCSGFTSVTIPNSVMSIGDGAFYGCSGLTSITIPNSVTSIGGSVFAGCSSLTTIRSEITNPDALNYYNFDVYATAILIVPAGKKAAYQSTAGWSKFQNIIEDGGVGYEFDGDGIRYKIGDNHTVSVIPKNTKYSGDIVIPRFVTYCGMDYYVTSLATSAFEGCADLTSVSIPYTVTTIGASAFEGCTGLNSVDIPSSVTTIGSGAFWSCTGLKRMVIPEGVTTIAETAFNLCSNLTAVVIPNSVTSIGSRAFANCSKLIQVISQIKNPFSINNNVFTTYSNITLVIPKGTKSAYQAKSGWKSFTNINDGTYDDPKTLNIHVAIAGTLPYLISEDQKYQVEGLTLTGELNGTDFRLIRDMAGIDNIEHAYSEYSVFEDCYTDGKLKSLDLTNSEIVKGGIFYYGYSESASLGWERYCYTEDNSLTSHLFYKTKLESIVLPKSVTSIGYSAFRDCNSLTSITIPNNVKSIDNYAFNGCGLTTITSEITTPFAIDDHVFDCYNTAKLTVPAGKKFAYQSTAGWSKFKNIIEVGGTGYEFELDGIRYEIGDNNTVTVCTKEGGYSGDINIPSQVTFSGKNYNVISIGSAFSGCTALNSISIPYGVKSIGSSAFSGCSGLTSVTIPNSVTYIGYDYVFCGCSSLTSIIIPNSVTKIGEFVFKDCTNLKSVTIGSGVNYIDTGAFTGCNNLTSVYITDLAAWCKIWFEYDSPYQCANPLEFAHHLYLNGTEIKDLVIPNSVENISMWSFLGCSNLTSVTIPNNVKSIGEYAFSGCSGLNSISIPSSVTSINIGAFSGCSGLTTITSEITSPFAINDDVFSNYFKATLIVPAGTKSAYQSTAGWSKFQNIKENIRGDVNLDGEVNKNDLTALEAHIMGKNPDDFYVIIADLNGDGEVNVADIVELLKIMGNSR